MIYDLFKQGQSKMLKDASDLDKSKAGKLRGGNSSLMTPEGKIIGTCANLTYLRYKGIEVEQVTPERDLMFDAGRRNEDHWHAVLSQSWDGQILREDEIATVWETTNGVKVTGRPDIVLMKDGKAVTGIELKLVSSLWTARDVMFQKKPKLSHIIQAAHYSWQLGCPFELWYTSRSDYAITGDWPKNLFPKAGEKDSKYCEYGFYREGDINPKTKKPTKSKIDEEEYHTIRRHNPQIVSCDIIKVKPFIQGYLLDIHEGRVYYKDATDDNSDWKETIVNIDDLKRYYDYVSEMEKNNKLAPEPMVMDTTGEKGNYTARQYCSLKELCCGKCKINKLDLWVDKVQARIDDKNSI